VIEAGVHGENMAVEKANNSKQKALAMRDSNRSQNGGDTHHNVTQRLNAPTPANNRATFWTPHR